MRLADETIVVEENLETEEGVVETKIEVKVENNKPEVITEDYMQFVDGWKEQYGLVYKSINDGNTIIWRPIRRGEYKDLLLEAKDISGEEKMIFREEAIVRVSCLYPNLDTLNKFIEAKAGFAYVVSEEIMSKSGFTITPAEEL